jgi:hypothetical protein
MAALSFATSPVKNLIVNAEKTLSPLINTTATPAETTANMKSEQVICPGIAELADNVTYDPEFSPVPTKITHKKQVLANGSIASALVSDLNGTKLVAIPAKNEVYPLTDSSKEPKLVNVEYAEAQGIAGVSGTSFTASLDGDIKGLAAGSCTEPKSLAWFLGGQTGAGDTMMLYLENPNPVAAQVELTMYGKNGAINMKTSKFVTVQEGAIEKVLISAAAPDEELVAIKVEAKGALIASYLFTYQVRNGIVANGMDFINSYSEPVSSGTINSVAIESADGIKSEAFLELFAENDAQVTYTVLKAGANDAGNSGNLSLTAGKTQSVPLNLANGVYSINFKSDEPVFVETLIRQTKGAEYSDFAYQRVSDVNQNSILQVYGAEQVISAIGEAGSVPENASIIFTAYDSNGALLKNKTYAISASQPIQFRVKDIAPENASYITAIPDNMSTKFTWSSAQFAEGNTFVSAITPKSIDAAFRSIKVKEVLY